MAPLAAPSRTPAPLTVSSSLFIGNTAIGGTARRRNRAMAVARPRRRPGRLLSGPPRLSPARPSSATAPSAAPPAPPPSPGSLSGRQRPGQAVANSYDSSLTVTGLPHRRELRHRRGRRPPATRRRPLSPAQARAAASRLRRLAPGHRQHHLGQRRRRRRQRLTACDNGGGGVFISGTSAHASFTDVLIALNSTTVAPGDGHAYGGGLYIGTGALTMLTNTMVVANNASTAGNNIYGTYTSG